MKKRQAASVSKKKNKTTKIKGQPYDANSRVSAPAAPKAQAAIPIPVKTVSDSTMVQRTAAAKKSKHLVNEAQRHVPKTSPILMRSAVKKPGLSLKRRLKISESTDRLIDKTPAVALSSHTLLAAQHLKRSQRAALLKQSKQISHFAAPRAGSVVKPTVEASRPAPHVIPPPAAPPGPADVLLQRALSQAPAHEQPLLKPAKSKKWYRAAFVASPVIVLALLIAGSHSFTSLQLKIASAKAGFSTNLPAYHPAGFALNQLSYNNGIFASEFRTKNSAQTYTITQKSTAWNAQDLLNNYVTVVTSNYHVVQLGSRTIYLYGNGDATWVSGNIWYQIDSDGSLSESQIIDMANSL
jgi:hypothetical protein